MDLTRYIKGRLAHFLSFPRRHRRIVTPHWRSVSTFADLLGARDPSILWLYEPAALAANRELLFPELANAEILRHHTTPAMQPAGIGVACMRNVLISGRSLVGTRSSLFLMSPVVPLFIDECVSSGHPIGDRRLRRKTKRVIPGASVLVTNWNIDTYGHWLLEGLPKLLLLKRIAHELPPLRIVAPASLPGWIIRWIELVLPNAAVERYDDAVEYVACETLLMPTLLISPKHFPHPELSAALDELCNGTPDWPEAPRHVYVTRVAANSFREMSNKAEIEAIAVEHGLSLIAPETLTVPQQIALFRQASIVVGEFGSSMHNALFSGPATRVFCLNWSNALQSYIAQLRGHRVGYLLPSDGSPVGYVFGAPHVSYHIDPAVFRACVKRLVTEP